MSSSSYGLNDALTDYLRRIGGREDADLAALRAETASHRLAMMQISPEQGQLMMLLMELIGARKALEIGVFTGYSSMCVAKAMGPSGRVIALDVSEEFTAIARRHWAKAGIADRIDLRLAPAVDGIKKLVAEGHSGTFDFAFIDADKSNYDAYYEGALTLLKQGGLIGIDNVFWSGNVVDPAATDADTTALKALNQKIRNDQRVTLAMIPIGDGLTLARKR
ncbi:MAG: methyltransferase domain-containing protein [Alphaproteobacteria bacterium]|nr:methyltransferase domain-containing protein [Alphaproteobacteria bacterium]